MIVYQKNFFEFCTRMLSVYEYTNQIKVISGSNFQNKKINSKNYYFSKYAHCWVGPHGEGHGKNLIIK